MQFNIIVIASALAFASTGLGQAVSSAGAIAANNVGTSTTVFEPSSTQTIFTSLPETTVTSYTGPMANYSSFATATPSLVASSNGTNYSTTATASPPVNTGAASALSPAGAGGVLAVAMAAIFGFMGAF
ncbi:hypothetical protein K440DRAFT_659963 [Wilcoxina mikolae CBS 423.85]|nr:hypothetical protein K440DRAFT_659963 [Wilcoxina mikolae CBS 423.85]